ncbi:MAG: hypothetical protein BGN96_13420 [Bacteroidales bacterium 45-6]|uniref:glycosyltransferase n=1 Tax=uncultured Dysgonomonas sp. TaxID=206096 RepID=UPI0009680494|nr:glycosyltransferase [uncultured Dysgonomonas sp.]OJU54279.1 MAG: hypothetical protein BGN96_13420 [Bacteroidales bacterium 45-6]
MEKILYILKHNPWGVGGGCYASRGYLEAFTDICCNGYAIDLCLCEEYVASMDSETVQKYNVFGVKPRPAFSRYLSFLTGEMHRYNTNVRELLKKNKYAYVFFDHNSIAGTLVHVAQANGAKIITLHHNYEPEYYRDNATNLIVLNLILPHVMKAEKRAYIQSDYNIFLTEEDQELFIKKYGDSKGKCGVIGSFEHKGVDILPKVDACGERSKDRIKMVVTGSLSNIQNNDGIQYLFKSLFKLIPEDCDLLLAGKNPTEEITDIVKLYNNVTLIANPTNMSEVIANADVYLCTTRLGSGIKIRIMDGLRLGLPVLTHKISSRGYTIFEKTKSLFVFTDEREFEEKLIELISRIRAGEVNKESIRKLYKKHFSFNAGKDKLSSFIFHKVDNY